MAAVLAGRRRGEDGAGAVGVRGGYAARARGRFATGRAFERHVGLALSQARRRGFSFG